MPDVYSQIVVPTQNAALLILLSRYVRIWPRSEDSEPEAPRNPQEALVVAHDGARVFWLSADDLDPQGPFRARTPADAVVPATVPGLCLAAMERLQ